MKSLIFSILFLCSLSFFAQTEDKKELKKKTVVEDYSGWSYNVLAGLSFKLSDSYIPVYGIGYFPRYNFVAPKKWMSASVGAPTQLGFEARSSSLYGSYLTFMLDLPIVLDLNLGMGATSDYDEVPIGGFAGTGLGFNYLYLTSNGTGYHFPSFGPVAHFGFKWKIYGRPGGIRLAYLIGIGGKQKIQNGIVFSDSNPDVLSFMLVYGI